MTSVIAHQHSSSSRPTLSPSLVKSSAVSPQGSDWEKPDGSHDPADHEEPPTPTNRIISLHGRVLGDRYRLIEVIGQGGMGTVWRAEHLALQTTVAVKVIGISGEENPDALARFHEEAKAVATLRSPHIVRVYDFGIDRGLPYMAMELLSGETLGAVIRRSGPLSPAAMANVLGPVADALEHAHLNGIVHRDVKPDNIFLSREDGREVVKVLDFGIAGTIAGAKGRRAREAEHGGTILGTPYYMSPEQAKGLPTDHRTDIWAFGIAAFECLIGRPPLFGNTMAAVLVAICSDPLPTPSRMGNCSVSRLLADV